MGRPVKHKASLEYREQAVPRFHYQLQISWVSLSELNITNEKMGTVPGKLQCTLTYANRYKSLT